jgi:predicted Zn-dependent protease
MHQTKTTRKLRFVTPVLATVAMAMTVPFNMGGCSQVTSEIGGAVGGRQGAALGNSVGKFAEAESISEKDEQAMGESVAMTVTTRYPVVKDQKLNQYVTLVGLTLANASPRPDGNWLFAVVDTPEANAFSGPDGYVLITRGLISKLRDESELAGVLGHEMSHVLDKHGLQAVKQAGRANALASLAQADERLGAFSEVTNGLVDTVLVKGYGREQEDQADHDAVKLLIATGYDPTGYLRFIERTAADQHGSRSSVMSTHPGAADRAKKIRQQIDKDKPTRQGAVLRERFEQNTRAAAVTRTLSQ